MSRQADSGGYYLGFKAWDEYLTKLRALQSADDKTRQDSMLGNSWIYECLAQFRYAAAQYLREVAGEFAPEAGEHLRKAADLYEKMASQVLRDDEHCLLTVAPLPWSLKEGQAWTNELRADQIRRLEAALPLERQAIQEIEAALVEL
jgi:hypothetical protein